MVVRDRRTALRPASPYGIPRGNSVVLAMPECRPAVQGGRISAMGPFVSAEGVPNQQSCAPWGHRRLRTVARALGLW